MNNSYFSFAPSLVPFKKITLVSACALGFAGNAMAQTVGIKPSPNTPDISSNKTDVEEVQVIGEKTNKPVNSLGQPEIILEGDALQIDVSNTLGETLSKQLGVNNASFGPSVGLPVLRGLSGVRVRLVQDGIGSWDGANLSGDHATTLEAASATSIRIVRGPAALAQGGGAIGGVVEVLTNRIPLQDTNNLSIDNNLDVQLQTRHELLNRHQQRSQKISIDGQSNQWSMHADGFIRSHNNVGISGQALDIEGIRQQFGDFVEFNFKDELPNSDAEASSYSLGMAWTSENWALGFASSQLNNDYGLPIGAHIEVSSTGNSGHDHGHNHDGSSSSGGFGDPSGIGIVATPVRLDMNQQRHETKLRWTPDNLWITELSGHIARIDYGHTEVELGHTGTEYSQDVTEARLTMDWHGLLGFEGSAGWQGVDRYFIATGDEAFVPATDLTSHGFFIEAERRWEKWLLSLGGRSDMTNIEPLAPTAPYLGESLSVAPMDYSAGTVQMALHYNNSSETTWRIGLSQTQRTPDIHELLSFGPHLATRSFDLGSIIRQGRLEPETFNHLELGLDTQLTWMNNNIGFLEAQIFASDAKDFIYQQNTGLVYDRESDLIQGGCAVISECLSVLEYSQADASFYGFEARLTFPTFLLGSVKIGGEIFSDYVRGQFKEEPRVNQVVFGEASAIDIPRLPPLRWGGEITLQYNDFRGSFRTTRVSAQTHSGLNELPTEGYWLANMDVAYRPNGQWLLFLRGKNLFNESVRNATSFLRHYAPEPARSVELGITFDF